MQGTIWRNILPRLQRRGCRSPALHSPGVWNTYRRQGEFLLQNKGGMRKQEQCGAPPKKRGLLQFGRRRINTVPIADLKMLWHKQFSYRFLSHPKETIEKKPKHTACKIKILGKSFHTPVKYTGALGTVHPFLCCLYSFVSPEHSKSNSQYLQAVMGLL